jgi:hypothetical protein
MKRTIASLALLRMNWDKYKKDYIEVFIPFIVTLICKKKYEIIWEKVIRKDFKEEFGLSIPYYPMLTLLNRAKKRGYIIKRNQKEHSYIPKRDLVEKDDFSDSSAMMERKYNEVSLSFITFCKKYDVEIDLENADRILIAFLKEKDLDILFASRQIDSVLPEVSTNEKEKFLISKFIQEAHDSDSDIFDFMVDIAFGHIIASSLLYENDLVKFQGKISANCYLDTGILFDLLGINYEDRENASKDLLKSLQDNGSVIYIFRHTYDELMGILEGCLEWIEKESYDPLKASRTLLFFKDKDYSASDVESFILGIDDKRKLLRIEIIEDSDPNNVLIQQYNIDEKCFYELLVGNYKKSNPLFDEYDRDFTLYQDVRSISEVTKLRVGKKPVKLSDAKHIFITTNSTLAYTSRQYERETDSKNEKLDFNYFYIPTTITDIFMGTILWAQSSTAKIESINQKKLIATCYAAMQPTKLVLKKFIDTAEKEYQKGSVTKDEYTLLRVSRMARNLLAEETLNDVERFTENTVTEILQEIHTSIQAEEEARFSEERKEFEAQKEQDKRILGAVTTELTSTKTAKYQIEKNIENSAEKISTIISKSAFIILAILALLTVIFQLIPAIVEDHLVWRIILVILTGGFTIASLITGFNIKGAKDSIKKYVKSYIVNLFID